MMLRWPKLGLTQPYYKYLWRCWLLVGLVLLQRISYGRMEEILQLRSSGRGSTGGSGSGAAQHHQQQQRQQLEEQELFSSSSSSNEIECPSFAENSACPCYKFEDGLFLECPSITAVALRSTLQLISSPIQSLSVYEFDRSVKSLTADLFASASHASAHTSSFLAGSGSSSSTSSTGNDVNIRHLQFSHSNLQQLKENSLNNLRAHLESLSIVNGKLTQVPTKALAGMKKLMVLDFEQNEISTIDEYAFYGLHLVKLNMKGNRLERIPETGLVGLEDSLAELDFSENRLKQFPTSALKRLENLRSVRLSMNEINSLEQDDSYTRFGSLVFLDLSLNNFAELYSDVFGAFPYVKTLSLYNNFIELVHRDSFVSLKELQSLDLSHNRIVFVDAEVFAANRKLHTVDLSHNHIHYVSGVFSDLPLLREIFLSENNILELTDDCFSNSSSIKVIYLENNSIQRLDAEALSSLYSLEQLYLSGNHIRRVPMGFFETTGKLQSLSLDNNLISELDVRVFRRLLNLREIRLNGNQIRLIQEQLFGTLGALMELHLQNNAIRVIERNAFKNCQLLQYINLQENSLDEIDIMFSYSTETSANHLQQPLTARGKLITAKTGSSDPSLFGELDSMTSSALISIQLNSNAIKYLHGRSFQGQSSVQTIWLENNLLNSLDKDLFVDVVQLERLYLKNNSISSIESNAFNSLRRLRFLDLSYNRLTNLNEKLFKNMVELDELLISKNQIQKLPSNVFGSLQKLRVLDLSHNPLGILESNVFHQNFSVSVINLKGCELTRIESEAFKGLQNLNELNLDDNRLRSEDIKQIDASSLRTLRLASNNFTVVRENTLERLPSLQVLVLERCSIRDLPYSLFSKNNNLVKLDLSHNFLRTLKRNIFNNLNVFKELRLQNNSINDFPHIALSNISTLETLILSNNQLTNVDFFKLHGLPNLRHLDLQDNSISSLTGFNTATLPHLDMIDLSGNLLLALPENFFKHSISLQRIDLSCNRFNQIPNAALSEFSLARLAWLNLTGNPLQRIHHTMSADADQRRFPFLKELHISQTNLTILTSKDFDIYPALQRLYLVQNRINRVSPGAFVTLANLQILDLSVNEIEMLPKERLQGLRLLEILNISNNNIKELDEFTDDLQRLKILDISSNQLERIQKNTLRHLVALQELYLNGNRIRSISSDAFRTLRVLVTLDLRKNFFEDVPLRALKPLETHLKQLRLEENHLNCSCETQELWEWLSDHRKWTSENVRCEQPTEVHGKSLLAMEPLEFCDVPMILKIAIQDIQPYSVLVSWQSREHSGLHGYHVIFHSLDTVEDFRGKTLNRLANSAKLDRLSSNTRYLICVLGLGNWLSYQNDINSLLNQSNQIQNQVLNNQNGGFMAGELDTSFSNTLLSLMMDTPTSKCTEVRTLDSIGPNPLAEVDGMSSQGIIHSILTRRLGLIVGCCLGIIVFIVLVSVLGYLKIKKQRLDAAKRQQQPMAPEFISYRHFSIPNDEHGRDGVAAATGTGGTNSFLHNNHHHHQHNHQNQQPVTTTVDGHPSFISGAVLGTTTTLNGGGTVPGAEDRKKIYIDS